ncbi:MAG: hypothetical protein IPJ65_17965 [Archangiaceae bacterium]|nr:hypothetical protein [Archangiaceae bacterium]
MTSLLLCVLAAADGGLETFPDAKAAFTRVLERKPAILAVGEYHEIEGQGAKVKSAVKRFTTDLLPQLKGRAGALVLETWMTNGRCGEVEKQATAAVAKTTQRPASTEDELTTLLDRSYKLGLANHILVLSCDEYRSMLGDDGELDGEKSLTLVRRKIEEKALEVREKGEAGTPQRPLLLYGGALHNDLQPADGFEGVTFGPSLQSATDGGYLELDLLVPEYVEKDEELKAQPWFKEAMKLSAAGKTVLVTAGPGSWALVFPRTRARR